VPREWPTASGGLRSLQTQRWQLIVPDAGPVELYDLDADPRQSTNLAADPRFADVLGELRDGLQPRFRRRAHAPITRWSDDVMPFVPPAPRRLGSDGGPPNGLRAANRRAHTLHAFLDARRI
jgi:hypothetical protein